MQTLYVLRNGGLNSNGPKVANILFFNMLLPCLQLKALAASLVMTGCAAAAGFYMMKATGLIQSDEARLPSTQQAWQIFMGKPKDRQQVHHLGGAQQ